MNCDLVSGQNGARFTCRAHREGLDGALVDADIMRLAALQVSDTRAYEVRVVGPSARLVAKVHKISERHGTGRQSDKDALDVLQLLRGTEPGDLASRWRKLLADKRSEETAREARALLEAQFSKRNGVGVDMAIRSAGVLADPEEIAASCVALYTSAETIQAVADLDAHGAALSG